MKNNKGIVFFSIFLVLLLTTFSILTACSTKTTTSTTAPPVTTSSKPTTSTTAPTQTATTTTPKPTQTTATTTATAPAKVIELKMGDWNPPSSTVGQYSFKLADKISENTGGRVKVTVYPAETLVKMNEMWRATQLGIVDLGYFTVTTVGSPSTLSQILTMPFSGYKSMWHGSWVAQQLYDTMPEIQKEWDDVVVMGFAAMPGSVGLFTKKQVTQPSDIKGMRIIASGQVWSDIISSGQAAPVTLNIGDWAMSLERGLVEGQFTHLPVSLIFKTLDFYKYITMFGEFGCAAGIECYMFNRNRWESFSPDIQKGIRDAVNWRAEELQKANIAEVQKGLDYAKSKNAVFTYLTPEQIKVWEVWAAPVIQTWVKGYEAKGLPAQKVYDQFKKLVASYTGK